MNSLTEEIFSGYLNTKFQVHTSSETAITLELIKVTSWQPTSSAKSANVPNLDCFSALCRGPRRKALASGTYRVTHDQLGDFELRSASGSMWNGGELHLQKALSLIFVQCQRGEFLSARARVNLKQEVLVR